MYEQWCSNARELQHPKWSSLANKKMFSWMLNLLNEQSKVNAAHFEEMFHIKQASLNLTTQWSILIL